jgi:hypothetical protein
MQDKPADKPSEKSVDKSVIVLHRMEPIQGRFHDAKKASEEWAVFLKSFPACKNIEVICCMENQIAWIESWESKMAVDHLNANHLPFADYLVRMLDCCRKVPTRFVYRRLP